MCRIKNVGIANIYKIHFPYDTYLYKDSDTKLQAY